MGPVGLPCVPKRIAAESTVLDGVSHWDTLLSQMGVCPETGVVEGTDWDLMSHERLSGLESRHQDPLMYLVGNNQSL